MRNVLLGAPEICSSSRDGVGMRPMVRLPTLLVSSYHPERLCILGLASKSEALDDATPSTSRS
jgi:hypothetical protein